MIQVNNLGLTNSIFNQILSEIRDVDIQRDSMRFRFNLERIGQIMAYEISKTMEYVKKDVRTQLGVKEMYVLKEQPVIATVLRAGIPFQNGFLEMFDAADGAFIAAYRKYDKNEDYEIKVEYFSSPDLEGRVLILCDPMLATGESLVQTLNGLIGDNMMPTKIHIVTAIASHEGLEYVKRRFSNMPVTIWVGAVDDELTAHAYIVPGMGDAGDLAYGKKH